MQGPTRRWFVQPRSEVAGKHATQFEDEQRRILVVGFDPFCRVFDSAGDETPCATALSELRKLVCSEQQR
jgi:hypothetical protein